MKYPKFYIKKNNGYLQKEILLEYNISTRQYSNLLLSKGIEQRKKVNKNLFNEDYFEKIDTEDKAYFLGFIVADGCISRKSNSI